MLWSLQQAANHDFIWPRDVGAIFVDDDNRLASMLSFSRMLRCDIVNLLKKPFMLELSRVPVGHMLTLAMFRPMLSGKRHNSANIRLESGIDFPVSGVPKEVTISVHKWQPL